MKKILIGIICNGKAGGVDKYLLNFYDAVKNEELSIDFITNKKDPELESFLNESGSRLYGVSSLMHPIRQYKQAKELIEKNGYDVVYMNISTAMSFPILKAAHDLKVKKVIAHSHSSGFDCDQPLKRMIFTFLHRACKGFVSKYANTHLCCSEKAAEWMYTKRVCKNNGYKIVFNAVDTSKFSYDPVVRERIREELGISDCFVIGNVGNLCYAKNQIFLIDVFAKLLLKEPSSRLVIIGEGGLRRKIEQRIKKRGISDKVIMLGRVDVSKGYMNAFDVFALPSNFEGLPIVAIEAQFSRVPCVISSRVSTLSKISNMLSFVPLNIKLWVEGILSYKNVRKEDFDFDKTQNFDLSGQAEEYSSLLSFQEK